MVKSPNPHPRQQGATWTDGEVYGPTCIFHDGKGMIQSISCHAYTALEPTAWKLPLAACVITLSMVLCVWPLTRLLQFPRKTQGGFLLATSCINSVYFAYPVTLVTFGEQELAHAVLFDLGQTTLTLTALYCIAI